ncbi:hypothetical protein [Paenibacillus paeoniae]|uniref:Uncharacterized protein n=1 Tax=Paenibacillus paeoniae TaxID=2292705 RepID=A0A371PP55_9BACL|nr:hypothetical protein [Paenibacillus paeoniae]REK77587.1 hypothetical protein DX130_11505 [Paenibacillus paeoniae]
MKRSFTIYQRVDDEESDSVESKSGKVKSVILFSLLGAVAIPIAVYYIFQFIFFDYYNESKGLLPGMGHMFICGVMIFINLILFPIANVMNYKKLITENASREDEERFVSKTTLIVVSSAVVQSVISLVIENPF